MEYNSSRTFIRYDLTISTVLKKKKCPTEPSTLELTKRTKDDSVVVNCRKHCRHAFNSFFHKYPDIFGLDREKLIYDHQCILFTEKPLKFGKLGNSDNSEATLQLNMEECEREEVLKEFKLVKMLLRKVNMNVELGDFSLLTNDMTKQNHTLPQFLELAVNQYPLNSPDEHVILGHTSYLYDPEQFGFNANDGPVLSKETNIWALASTRASDMWRDRRGVGTRKLIL